MRAQRVVFSHTFEGLFLNALGARVTPRLKQRLADEAHVNLDRLLPAYPLEDWARAVQVTVEELYPALPVEEAYTEVGRQVVAGYFETLIGRALAAMVRVLGPERTLRRLERNMRGANNYTKSSLTEVTPRRFVVTVNEPGLTRYVVRGILLGGLTLAGAQGLKVEVTRVDGDTSTYEVTWSA